jgi:hypothetical protein
MVRRQTSDAARLTGTVRIRKYDADGQLLLDVVRHNLTTYVGDQMYAGLGGWVSGAPAVPTGMKLGTGNTATYPPAKSGAGAALVTYLAGSECPFDSGFPNLTTVVVNTVTEQAINYQCTWGLGVATTALNLTEVAIVNDALVDAASSAGNTIARVSFGALAPKTAAEVLTIAWAHNLVGT